VFERSLEHPARFDETATRAVGYAGGDRYVDVPTVIDGDLITGGPKSPVQFARAALKRLALASEPTLDAYEDLFHSGDPAAFSMLAERRVNASTPKRPRRAGRASDRLACGFTFEEAVVGEVGGRPVTGTVARRSR